jgi:DNA-binding MarR family transcriptional regulator
LTLKEISLYLVYERNCMPHYEDCVVFLLAKAYQKAHSNLKRRLAPYGLTPIQFLVLEAVKDNGGVSAGDLGKRLTLDSATLSGVLDRLAEKGWIVKKSAEQDRRSLRIDLGPRIARDPVPVPEIRENTNYEVMVNLSEAEKALLKRLLKDLEG